MADNIISICYSPSGGTSKVADIFCKGLRCSGAIETIDIFKHPMTQERDVDAKTLLVVSIPVYAGRVPAVAAESLSHLKGEGTPAVIIAVYGNRDYDDALIEARDILAGNGFRIIAAGAFIARHSIFPDLAKGRPDNDDAQTIDAFAAAVNAKLQNGVYDEPAIPGNRPYRKPGKVPVYPRADKSCNGCGLCARECPCGAIPVAKPRVCDKSLCISCGHCISICPQKARRYSGIIYNLAARKFYDAFSDRKECETFI